MKNLDKEEFRVKLEEINHLVEQKDYKGAMNVVDSIDWRRVKNVRTLCVVGEIYAANKRYEDSKEIFLLAYHRASIVKNILLSSCRSFPEAGTGFPRQWNFIRSTGKLRQMIIRSTS